MNINNLFKKAYHFIGHMDTKFVQPDMSEQLKFLFEQAKPLDDNERGFLQYKCQMKLMSPVKRLIQQTGAFFMFWPYTVMLLLKKQRYVEKCDAVFVQNGMNTSIIPESLSGEFGTIHTCAFTDDAGIGLYELKKILKLVARHPFSYFFHIKVCMKLALYKSIITQYRPRAIISYCETSYASAIATEYLEEMGIEHINVMHGDFLKSIRFSGFRFSKFYVWDEHFSEMFKALGNDTTPYLVEQPSSLTQACKKPDENEIFPYFLTYYLGNENHDTLMNIKSALDKFGNKGLKCKVRIHPRETDLNQAEQIFGKDNLELPANTTLKASMENSKYLCAYCSTVLYQGWMCGKSIIIDDISNRRDFELLKEKEYILLKKSDFLLSELIEEM